MSFAGFRATITLMAAFALVVASFVFAIGGSADAAHQVHRYNVTQRSFYSYTTGKCTSPSVVAGYKTYRISYGGFVWFKDQGTTNKVASARTIAGATGQDCYGGGQSTSKDVTRSNPTPGVYYKNWPSNSHYVVLGISDFVSAMGTWTKGTVRTGSGSYLGTICTKRYHPSSEVVGNCL